MNLLDQFWTWLVSPAAPTQNGPSIGDALLRIAASYLNTTTAQAQQKANVTVAAAPADNAPGATNGAADAPLGQRLSDVLKSYSAK